MDLEQHPLTNLKVNQSNHLFPILHFSQTKHQTVGRQHKISNKNPQFRPFNLIHFI
ncbi:hypothetical protein Hanom_Chr07g00606821 [Helianthus anomalus]